MTKRGGLGINMMTVKCLWLRGFKLCSHCQPKSSFSHIQSESDLASDRLRRVLQVIRSDLWVLVDGDVSHKVTMIIYKLWRNVNKQKWRAVNWLCYCCKWWYGAAAQIFWKVASSVRNGESSCVLLYFGQLSPLVCQQVMYVWYVSGRFIVMSSLFVSHWE